MAAAARCSECPAPLVNEDGIKKPVGTKTCSPAHRKQRARRLKRQRKAVGAKSPYADELQDVAAAVRGHTTDVAHEVLKEELRPIVREAMTADVLRGIEALVKINPRAIEILAEQMESDDETIAQRAVTLALKFTLGNPSVAPPPTHVEAAPLTVQFNIPRPGDATSPSDDVVSVDALPLRECTDCSASKTDAEFVGASDRCEECFEKLKGKVAERLGD